MGKSSTLYYKICPHNIKYINSSFIFAKQERKDTKNFKIKFKKSILAPTCEITLSI